MGLDLVTVWALILAFGLAVYVMLDGIHLGVGVLTIGLRNTAEQVSTLKCLAPVCYANVVWLLLCALGVMVVFPLAFSIMIDAFLVPFTIVLLSLLLRNISFQKLITLSKSRSRSWGSLFAVSSLIAAFIQGAVLGAVIQGVSVTENQFSGGVWDWLTWFSVLMGVSVVLAYTLLGSTWVLALNKEPMLGQEMRHYSRYLLVWLGYATMMLQLVIPFLTEALRERWLGLPNFFYMGFVPMLALMAFVWAYYVVRFSDWKVWPISIVLIFLGTVYFTLVTSIWPSMIPPHIALTDAATSEANLVMALWSAALLTPIFAVYLYSRYEVFFKAQLSYKAQGMPINL